MVPGILIVSALVSWAASVWPTVLHPVLCLGPPWSGLPPLLWSFVHGVCFPAVSWAAPVWPQWLHSVVYLGPPLSGPVGLQYFDQLVLHLDVSGCLRVALLM